MCCPPLHDFLHVQTDFALHFVTFHLIHISSHNNIFGLILPLLILELLDFALINYWRMSFASFKLACQIVQISFNSLDF